MTPQEIGYNDNKMKKLIFMLAMCATTMANAQDKDNFNKTDEVLAEVVKKALTVAEKTGQFVIEQAPLLLQEFYRWHITKSALGVVCCLLFFLIVFLLMRRHSRYIKENDIEAWEIECALPRMFSILSSVIVVCIMISFVYNLLFILVAPKLYLIEYFVK